MSAALSLHRAGWQPTIIERAPERRTGGYFIGLFPEGPEAAEELEVLSISTLATARVPTGAHPTLVAALQSPPLPISLGPPRLCYAETSKRASGKQSRAALNCGLERRIPTEPPVGFMISYEYVWKSHGAEEDGRKVYPTIIIAELVPVQGKRIAYGLGCSHRPPKSGELAIEIPTRLKKYLGRDLDPAWVYVNQANVFEWVGPDVRLASHHVKWEGSDETCVIGEIPTDWFETVRAAYRDAVKLRKSVLIKRKDETRQSARSGPSGRYVVAVERAFRRPPNKPS